jgi:hypothetical protein
MIPVKKIYDSMKIDTFIQFKGFTLPVNVSTYPDIGITGVYIDLYGTDEHKFTILIEVDPNQHSCSSYNRKDEVTRNMRILNNIETKKVLLIRFNSIGKYKDSGNVVSDSNPNMRIMILRMWVIWYLQMLNNYAGEIPGRLVLYMFYNYDVENMSFVKQRECYSPEFRKNVGWVCNAPAKNDEDTSVWRYHADPSDGEAIVKLHRSELNVSVSGCMTSIMRVSPSKVWPDLTLQ